MQFPERFEILGEHRGGMASVLVCRDRMNGRFVATKTPLVAPERFDREARLWIGLGRHPNIVQAHLVDVVDDAPMLFMEFVGDAEGVPRTLRRLLSERGRLTVAETLRLAGDVLEALRHAQSVFPGFVHRDLKPDNILVRDDGTFCVADFGIGQFCAAEEGGTRPASETGRALVSGDTLATESGGFLGTVRYASPEQREGTVSLSSDLYSLGVVLEEALCGGAEQEVVQTARAAGSAVAFVVPPPPLEEPGAAELFALIGRLRDPTPESRPALDDLLAALAELGRAAGVADRPPPAPAQADDDVTFANRIRSLAALGRLDLAAPAVEQLQRRSPWSSEIPALARAARFSLGRTFVLDLLRPTRALFLLASLVALIAAIVWRLGPEEGPRLAILGALLFVETYVNRRTSRTKNIITFPGMLVGLLSTAVIQGAGVATVGGGWLLHVFAIAGSLATLTVALRIGLGAGTVKLLAVIAAFIGPWAGAVLGLFLLQFLVVAGVVRRVRGKDGGLVWQGDRLCWSSFGREPLTFPTSPAILIATVLTLLVIIPLVR